MTAAAPPTHPRVAVVGDGPRALWAQERLLAHLGGDPGGERGGHPARRSVQVDVFGPGTLGAGANYDPDQPDFLRLNLPVDQVDVWSLDGRHGPGMEHWWGPRQESGELAVYPSRATAGRYLAEQADTVLQGLAALLGPDRVRQHRRTVRRVRPAGQGVRARESGRWLVDEDGPFDEVLLATGHTTDWPGALRHDWAPDLPPLHPAVFPVRDLLDRAEIRPGATVLVRGASLTGIDAVLALGFGRGRHPARSDLHIVLASRSGALMTPKSPAALVQQTHRLAGDTVPFRERASRLVRSGQGAALPGVLRDLAVHLLAGAPRAAEQVGAVLARIETGTPPEDPIGRLRQDVAVARGKAPPDGQWAVGQAWRVLFADLVEGQRHGDPEGPTLGWPGYRRWVPELERLGYGPPLMNAELLLAAADAGVLSVRAGDTAALAREVGAALVVDAVLPPPGIRDLPVGHLLRGLAEDGHLVPVPQGRGARVGPAAEVLDDTGTPVPGLSLVGRATEDLVMGTDTLIRTMHPALDGWARRVLRPVPA